MNILLLALSILSPHYAQALELPYACQVIVAASDVPADKGSWSFDSEVSESGHGGSTRTFEEGIHRLEVIANQQWLGLNWFKNGQKIAQGVFVLGKKDRAGHRVAILYDPSDSGDQVSINCEE